MGKRLTQEEVIEKLKQTQLNDQIKTQYCLNNKIKLFRINYKQNILEEMNKILEYMNVNLF